uniref:Secreted peptide n=1 Tax=Anopheles christyi TaxID=43041 RepID=A0A182KHV7_9DIPT
MVVVVVVINSLPLLLLCCTKSISEVRSNVAADAVEVLLLTEAFVPVVVMATTVAPPPSVIVSPVIVPADPTLVVAVILCISPSSSPSDCIMRLWSDVLPLVGLFEMIRSRNDGSWL